MEYEQHFFVEGSYLGTTMRKDIYVRSTVAPPMGEAFFCPFCARIWAVCPVVGQPTAVSTVLCEKHNPKDSVGDWQIGYAEYPGSILFSWDDEWNSMLPRDAFKREFLLYCKRHNIGTKEQ